MIANIINFTTEDLIGFAIIFIGIWATFHELNKSDKE